MPGPLLEALGQLATKADRSLSAEVRRQETAENSYLICIPEIAREITSRWISDVPSKIV
jgi:hypothetical protein